MDSQGQLQSCNPRNNSPRHDSVLKSKISESFDKNNLDIEQSGPNLGNEEINRPSELIDKFILEIKDDIKILNENSSKTNHISVKSGLPNNITDKSSPHFRCPINFSNHAVKSTIRNKNGYTNLKINTSQFDKSNSIKNFPCEGSKDIKSENIQNSNHSSTQKLNKTKIFDSTSSKYANDSSSESNSSDESIIQENSSNVSSITCEPSFYQSTKGFKPSLLKFIPLSAASLETIFWAVQYSSIELMTSYLFSSNGYFSSIGRSLINDNTFCHDDDPIGHPEIENFRDIIRGTKLLHYACRVSSPEMIRWFIEVVKLSIKQRDSFHRTPLHHAVMREDEENAIEILKILNENGDDFTSTSSFEMNAVHWSSIAVNPKVIRYLFENSTLNPNDLDEEGSTGLV